MPLLTDLMHTLIGQRHLWSPARIKPGWQGQEALRMAPTVVVVNLKVRLHRVRLISGRQVTSSPQPGPSAKPPDPATRRI